MTSINYHQISNMMSEQLNVTLLKTTRKKAFLIIMMFVELMYFLNLMRSMNKCHFDSRIFVALTIKFNRL